MAVVELHEYADQASFKRVLRRVLHRLIVEEDVLSEDIVILTPKGRNRSWLWQLGSVGNFRITDQWGSGGADVFCSTVHSFKGLESPIVILAEIDFEIWNLESILYVGCSRACNHLVILASEHLSEETKARLTSG